MDRYAENRQRQIYDIATQKLRVQTRNRSIVFNRSILFMGLLLSMLTMGLLAIVLAPAFTASAFPQAKQRQGGTRVATATMAPSPTATPSPTPMPSPTPTVQPVEPWPSTLDAQIATLKAHNRFFYQGNSALPEIALTFDDGPDSTYTPQVLAILKAYHVPATFFTVGSLVQSYPALVRQEIADGHAVGNHSWSHPDLSRLSAGEIQSQIQRTSDILEQVTGRRPVYFRPPYGNVSSGVVTAANTLGLTTVLWDDEARDWALPGAPVIVTRILNLAGNGAIILMHDGGGNRSQTVAALPTIIAQLMARGYTFVSMDELMQHLPGQAPAPTPVSSTPARSPESLAR